LTKSIRRVRDGRTVIDAIPDPPVATDSRSPMSSGAHVSSPRERECLTLLVEGLSTKAMARRLGVAPTTVRSHVQSILTKLGTHSRLQAAALAVRHHLVRLGKDDGWPTARLGRIRRPKAAPDDRHTVGT
jgi:two-component system, NarL family, nitrate/nitrite response regulator NarL